MQEVRLKIGKMTCVNCANAIEKVACKIAGVKNASVSYVNSSGVFLVDNANLKGAIAQKIKSLGYEILQDSENLAEFKQKELVKLRYNLTLSAFISATTMILMAFVSNSALFQAILGSFGVFYCGRSFYKNAFKGLKNASFDMNTLITLGSFCAIFYSFLAYFGVFEAHLYFGEASMIVSFVLLGKFLEENAKFKAHQSENSLLSIDTSFSFVQNANGDFEKTPSSFVKAGDIVLVKADESVSVDGVVVEGRAEVDMSFLSGEFVPLIKQKGDEIEAGSLLVSGTLTIKATKKAMDSRLELIKDLIFRAGNAKMPIARLVDRISAYFVGFILLLAGVVFAFWAVESGLNSAFLHASAVLLISCPCALGLATPIALVLAINNATKHFILIKNPASLELLRKAKLFIFDKTGTLSKETLSVFAHNLTQSDFDLLCAMENLSPHPIAKAISSASVANLTLQGEFESLPARGIRYKMANHTYLAGNAALLAEFGVSVSKAHKDFVKSHEVQAPIVVYFAKDKECLGAVCLTNELRDEAQDLVEFLRKNSLHSVILSGDNEKSVALNAQKLGIDEFRANLSPQDKLEALQEYQKKGVCVFVGDGINDAAALSLTNVSFAMNSGSALAKSAGDFVLIKDDLRAIAYAFKLSQKTFTIIKQNLFWAFFYNACCIPIAAGVPSFVASFATAPKIATETSLVQILAHFTLTPHLAALAMCFSSLAVVLNSLRLKKDLG